jgi:hypothetical protein
VNDAVDFHLVARLEHVVQTHDEVGQRLVGAEKSSDHLLV